MKRTALWMLLPATIVCVTTFSYSQSSIREIDAYAKRLDAYVKTHKSSAIIAADVSDYKTSSTEDWRVFKTQSAFRTLAKKQELYTTASNWKQKGKLVISGFSYSSPSGDWSQTVDNYFRPDGTLAKAESEMRTFVQNCVIKKNFYYSRSGKLISKSAKYYDVRTDRPKKPCEAMNSGDVTYFTSVSKLPFANKLP